MSPFVPTLRSEATSRELTQASPHVAILMATYNGEKYLEEQLHSLEHQTLQNWSLHVSDDGSTDDSLQKIVQFSSQYNRPVSIYHGPRQGFATNFISLLDNPDIVAEYYAFCDQDDIWEDQKLERAIAALSDIPDTQAALYFTRTNYVDANGQPLGNSIRFTHEPCFSNALVQSIGGGNTMVFNRCARELLRRYTEARYVISHDWWIYIAISAVGGRVIYDDFPSVRYRQHGKNEAGQNTSVLARLQRLRTVLAGTYGQWNGAHLKALSHMRLQITQENLRTMDLFAKARSGFSLMRLYCLYKSGVFRRPAWSQLGLYVAALTRKL